MVEQPENMPIGASYAIAEAFTREWFGLWSQAPRDDLLHARHRKLIELPRAQRLLAELRRLPKADRLALASAIKAGATTHA